MGRNKMSGKRSSQFQRVSKFAPSTKSVKPIKNTKISRNTLGVHGHTEGKRQSAVNYYERLDEKTSQSVKSRKTAVEREIEISHTLEEKKTRNLAEMDSKNNWLRSCCRKLKLLFMCCYLRFNNCAT